jgi:hypothetical protein
MDFLQECTRRRESQFHGVVVEKFAKQNRRVPLPFPSLSTASYNHLHTMPQPKLPLECILGVIRLLSNDHDTDTMAR